MKNIGLGYFILAGVMLFAQITIAAESLRKDEAEKLLIGNTAEGYNTVRQKSVKWFFHKSGKVRALDQYGKRSTGDWHIDSEGRLCTEWKFVEEKCRTIVPRSDGGFDIFGTAEREAGDLIWIFKRILQGNPYGL